MSPLQLAVLSQIDTVDRRAIADLAAGLGAEIGRSKSRTLNILLRALNRIADSEQRIAEKDELIAQLQSQALTDPLTGLINRRGFEDSVRKAVASAHRFDESGVLAYIDLDEFKPINDRFGHPVQPQEWFLVPLFVVDEAVERIKDGTITRYVYDPKAARLRAGCAAPINPIPSKTV